MSATRVSVQPPSLQCLPGSVHLAAAGLHPAAQVGSVQPPNAQCLPGSVNLPAAEFPPAAQPGSIEAAGEAAAVIEVLNQALSQADYKAISELFVKDGFWRDHLALSWEFRTVRGKDEILRFLYDCAKSRDGFRLQPAALDTSTPFKEPKVVTIDIEGKIYGIQAFFLFKTAIGSGEGVMRLILQQGEWKIFTFYTSLRELRGHQEGTFHRRPFGVDYGEKPGRKNWTEERQLEADFSNGGEPPVLIVGAGQAGLTIAARLKMLGLNSLIIDQNDRVGDNWRKRYHQLVLHDPVWFNHMPYMDFPPQWPIYTPKDRLAQFFEAYVNLLELNVWMKAKLTNCTWNEQKSSWTVTIHRKMDNGSSRSRTLHPHHVIQATGLSGEKYLPSIKGAESFEGDRICHSSEFPGASEGASGKKAVVIGSCNSGLDIAQDFVEKGYDVTIVQRSSTNIVSCRAVADTSLKGLYLEDGPPVDDADMLMNSLPNSVLKAIQIQAVEIQREQDKDILTALSKAGFKMDYGPDGAGFLFSHYQRGGGYYIDVCGASKLIAHGSIKIKQGQEVIEILPRGVRFADGSELEADEIILATGYQNVRAQTRLIFGDKIADRVHDVWGFNGEGEMRAIWQNSGHPGFWFHGGTLGICRFFSKLLALQIKGLEEGLYKYGEI